MQLDIIVSIYLEAEQKIKMNQTCLFCTVPPEEYVQETSLAYARRDIYPVSNGHTLIIPKRHLVNFFDTLKEERDQLFQVIESVKKNLQEELNPNGFNLTNKIEPIIICNPLFNE